ncbi:DUF4013 domain-containing protein [Methanobacterium aggregans]|uniref:DUF4013 domain-containing protein n=1 Tax=Methanobacterium aggregans TaxID=1615586 RepID=UPI001AE6D5F0|nr:DUF4013 domain-containing protein [Methanobacterium aggregans]MBP2046310.1 hypothetical protein [Methanobacterium aggregans]
MDVGNVMTDSIKYPSSNWKKVLILGVMILFSFLIIPLFVALGYFLRVLKASLAGLEDLPEFDEWVDMIVDGIKVFLVGIVYSLPAIVILAVSMIAIWGSLSSITAMQSAGMSPTTALGMFTGIGFVGMIVAMLYLLIITPVLYVAIANMAYNEELGAAFRFSEIIGLISQIGWVDLIVWYVVVILIGFVVSFIGGIIGIIPIIGGIIAALTVYPYYNIFLSRAIAWLYASAFPEE